MAQDMASTTDDSPRFRSIGRELRDFLSGAKRAIDEEIGAYPTPIPRCDAQFNHLYEQRSRIARTLDRVNDALGPGDALDELVAIIAEFTAEAPIVGSVQEERLRWRIRIALARGRHASPNARRADTTS
jgi:hypothetical protein